MNPDDRPQHIIVVDDDPPIREAIEMILAGAGHIVRTTDSGQQALQWLDEGPCDLLIIDFKMPEVDGPALYRAVRSRWHVAGPRVLFISGYEDVVSRSGDPEIGSVPVLAKPFTLGDLFEAVQHALTVR